MQEIFLNIFPLIQWQILTFLTTIIYLWLTCSTTTISTYIRMLNQAESAWEIAALWGRGAWQVWGDIAEEEWGGAQWALGPNPRTLEQQLNMGSMNHEGLLIQKWAQEEGEPTRQCSPGWEMKIQEFMCSPQVRNSPANSTKTRRSISKSQGHNLFSARGLPEFLDSEWVKVLQGKVVDLDIIISVIHSIITDNQATETFGDFEFQFGHLKPTKTVRNHGDWLIVYSAFQHTMWFIYPHRESELIRYSEYITAYFVSTNAGGQNQVLNLNKAIWCWSGSVNNMLLDQFEKFRFLEVWHIFSKAAGDQGAQGNQWGSSAGQCGGVSAWWSKDPCWLFNQGKCGKKASKCWYRHVCIRCGKKGYAEKECTSKKAWVISCEGQETEACQKISMESQWVSDEELGPTTGYSLTAKPLPHPSPMA